MSLALTNGGKPGASSGAMNKPFTHEGPSPMAKAKRTAVTWPKLSEGARWLKPNKFTPTTKTLTFHPAAGMSTIHHIPPSHSALEKKKPRLRWHNLPKKVLDILQLWQWWHWPTNTHASLLHKRQWDSQKKHRHSRRAWNLSRGSSGEHLASLPPRHALSWNLTSTQVNWHLSQKESQNKSCIAKTYTYGHIHGRIIIIRFGIPSTMHVLPVSSQYKVKFQYEYLVALSLFKGVSIQFGSLIFTLSCHAALARHSSQQIQAPEKIRCLHEETSDTW